VRFNFFVLMSALQAVDEFKYYSIVTASAERAVTGCPAAVREVLASTLAAAKSKDEVTLGLGLCEPLPLYVQEGGLDLLVDEINMIVMYTCKSPHLCCLNRSLLFYLFCHWF
jgi:hypothetical protein